MSGYQDYLDALEVLGSAAERAARARDQAGDYGRDDLRHAAMDRREHEQEWDRILTETTHLSRSAQTLARSHGLPVAEAAEAPGVPASVPAVPPGDLAGCGRAVRGLRADLNAAQELWRGVDTAQVPAAPAAPPAPPTAPPAPLSPEPVSPEPASPAPRAEPAPAAASLTLKLVLAVVLVIAVVCGIIAFA